MNHPRMDAVSLCLTLVERGIVVLGVMSVPSDPDRLTVYLHGPAGKTQQENAFTVLTTLPGVADVQVSVQTPSILLVRLRSGRTG